MGLQAIAFLLQAFLEIKMRTYFEAFADQTNRVRRPFVIPVRVASLTACNAFAVLALVVVKNSGKMILADVTHEWFWI